MDAAAIRNELDRILASETFTTAGRHSRLLRYVVERTLAGEGDQLKEYVLGTEVFDRATSYDPRLDSIVRVEVRRLRSRLEEYYRGPGCADPVAITIPRGSYVPMFEPRTGGVAPANERRWVSPGALIALAFSVVIVVLAASLALNDDPAPAEAASVPGVAVLPFEHYSTSEQDALLVAHLTDAVTVELAKLESVTVASRTSAHTLAGRSVIDVAKALDVDFVMESSAVITGEVVHVVTRMVDARLDRKIWVGEYDVRRIEVLTMAPRIAAEAAAATLKYIER
jgi:adenylate cyclase